MQALASVRRNENDQSMDLAGQIHEICNWSTQRSCRNSYHQAFLNFQSICPVEWAAQSRGGAIKISEHRIRFCHAWPVVCPIESHTPLPCGPQPAPFAPALYWHLLYPLVGRATVGHQRPAWKLSRSTGVGPSRSSIWGISLRELSELRNECSLETRHHANIFFHLFRTTQSRPYNKLVSPS